MKDTQDPSRNHRLGSSNLHYFDAVWNAAKWRGGVIHFFREFYWGPISTPRPENDNEPSFNWKHASQKEGRSAEFCLVAKNGRELIKVSTTTENRILHELAKQGWQYDSDESEEASPSISAEDDSEDEMSLVKMAEKLSKASRASRVRQNYRHNEVHIILPRIRVDQSDEVQGLLEDIRATGAILHCADEVPRHVKIEDALPNLIMDESRDFSGFSETLNVDCSILIALCSDISHREVGLEECYKQDLIRQREEESKEKLLPVWLYPALVDHSLICTEEAAESLRKIVLKIGTETEKARVALLLGDDKALSREQLRAGFRELSKHPVPEGLQLPVRVVSKDVEGATLPSTADIVRAELTPVNRSVYLYGWASGLTTVTSSLRVAAHIENLVERHRTSLDETGPDIWVCPFSRALLAKKKEGRSYRLPGSDS